MALFSNLPVASRRSASHAARIGSALSRAALILALATATLIAPAPTTPLLAASADALLRQNLPGALRGNRVAVREVAKAIVKIGPRQFTSAAQIRPLIRAEALRGSSAASNAYGIMLQYGIGGPKLPKEAASWYAKGGAEGNIGASKNAALAYALGWGVKRNTKKASQLLATVPAEQRARKMLEISKALMQPGREEPDLALFWLEKAVALDPNGQLNAAGVYRDVADSMADGDERLIDWLQPLADKGNPRAALLLARRLEGTGTEADIQTAADLYLDAAASGNANAYQGLGRILVSAPTPLADRILTLLEQQAAAGSVQANVALGTHYLFGSAATVEKRKLGLKHLQTAANAGDADTQYRVAMILLGDANEAKQHELARAYLALSAASGNKLAAAASKQFGTIKVADARMIVNKTQN